MMDDTEALLGQLRRTHAQMAEYQDLARALLGVTSPTSAHVPAGWQLAVSPGPIRQAHWHYWPHPDPGHSTLALIHPTGHGGRAELLGLFAGQWLATHELQTQAARPPGEVLTAFNMVLTSLARPEPPVVAMLLMRIDWGTGQITFARAGVHPPCVVDASGQVTDWLTPGPLLGICPAEFPSKSATLNPGERLLMSSHPTRPGNAAQALDDHDLAAVAGGLAGPEHLAIVLARTAEVETPVALFGGPS